MVFKRDSVLESFYKARRCTASSDDVDVAPSGGKKKKKQVSNRDYSHFLELYDNLEKFIDSFDPVNLVYYFREVASECGYKYYISMTKDCAVFRNLLKQYEPREICGMIEFLFHSGQRYIDLDRVSIGVLSSRWVNTIYADTLLWIEDKYDPNRSKKKNNRDREWSGNKPKQKNTIARIGEWS